MIYYDNHDNLRSIKSPPIQRGAFCLHTNKTMLLLQGIAHRHNLLRRHLCEQATIVHCCG